MQGGPVALKASFFCANGHDEAGASKTPEVPSLAGQNAVCLQTSVKRYCDDAGIRNNRLMAIAAIAQRLTQMPWKIGD